MAQHFGLSSWESLVAPPKPSKKTPYVSKLPYQIKLLLPDFDTRYPNTKVMGPGPCSQYPNMAHLYTATNTSTVPVDLYASNASCVNGWADGNMAASAEDAAKFYWVGTSRKEIKNKPQG